MSDTNITAMIICIALVVIVLGIVFGVFAIEAQTAEKWRAMRDSHVAAESAAVAESAASNAKREASNAERDARNSAARAETAIADRLIAERRLHEAKAGKS